MMSITNREDIKAIWSFQINAYASVKSAVLATWVFMFELFTLSKKISNSTIPIQSNHNFRKLNDDIIRDKLLTCLNEQDQFALILTSKQHAFFRPSRLLIPFLEYVVKGNQETANDILGRYPDLQLRRGEVTDYSGRCFKNINAYEYAYWAKDKHMLRMLGSHMNSATKQKMLTIIKALEVEGLTYSQRDQIITGSQYFDIAQLQKAYVEFNRIYLLWSEAGYPLEGNAGVIAALMAVGKEQGNLPVHYVNECFRYDRSFSPLPGFDEDFLPRQLHLKNKITGQPESLFPLQLSESSGLGIDTAFARGALDCAQQWSGIGGGNWWLARIASDYQAFSLLDEVRMKDRQDSLNSLSQADFSGSNQSIKR